jgi:hypothetical protein
VAPFQKSVDLGVSKVSHPGRGVPTAYVAGGLNQRQWGSNEAPPNSSEWSSKEEAFQAIEFQETGLPSPTSFDVYVAVAGRGPDVRLRSTSPGLLPRSMFATEALSAKSDWVVKFTAPGILRREACPPRISTSEVV